MNLQQRQVREFHEAFAPIKDNTIPHTVDMETASLRQRLMYEEFLEVSEEMFPGQENADEDFTCDMDAVNLSKLAKELADLLYVVYGCAETYGIDIEPVFEEVHRSNMTKTGGSKREDGKILKGDNYVPPDIAAIIAKQQEGWSWAPTGWRR